MGGAFLFSKIVSCPSEGSQCPQCAKRGEKGRGIVLRSVKVSGRVTGGERRWCVDEVVGDDVLRSFL